MDIIKFVYEYNLVVIPALWIVGTFLKRSNINDKYIPWILLVIGIATTVTMKLRVPLVEAIIQGILVTGVAVLGHQLLKQSKK